MTATMTRCAGCGERPAASEGVCLACDDVLADACGTLGLQDAIRFLPLETILRTVRDHCAAQVGPGYTRREMEFDMLKDDLDATLVGTCWDRVDA